MGMLLTCFSPDMKTRESAWPRQMGSQHHGSFWEPLLLHFCMLNIYDQCLAAPIPSGDDVLGWWWEVEHAAAFLTAGSVDWRGTW